MAYQPHSSVTVSATFVADVDRWLRRVCRVGRLLLPLLPLYSFMHRSDTPQIYSPLLFSFLPLRLLSSAHDHLRLPPMSYGVDSRHFHVAFACISVAEIRTAYCTRSSDELTILKALPHVTISSTISLTMLALGGYKRWTNDGQTMDKRWTTHG